MRLYFLTLLFLTTKAIATSPVPHPPIEKALLFFSPDEVELSATHRARLRPVVTKARECGLQGEKTARINASTDDAMSSMENFRKDNERIVARGEAVYRHFQEAGIKIPMAFIIQTRGAWRNSIGETSLNHLEVFASCW